MRSEVIIFQSGHVVYISPFRATASGSCAQLVSLLQRHTHPQTNRHDGNLLQHHHDKVNRHIARKHAKIGVLPEDPHKGIHQPDQNERERQSHSDKETALAHLHAAYF